MADDEVVYFCLEARCGNVRVSLSEALTSNALGSGRLDLYDLAVEQLRDKLKPHVKELQRTARSAERQVEKR